MGAVPAVQQEEQLGEAQGGAGHGCGGMAWTLVNLGHFLVPASPPPPPPSLPPLHVLDSRGSCLFTSIHVCLPRLLASCGQDLG